MIPGRLIDYPEVCSTARNIFTGKPAQFLEDFFSPRARLLEAARSVNGKVGVTKLLLLRHLRGDAPLGLLAREVVAPHQAFELRFGTAVDDDELVEASVSARLDQQGRVHDGDAARVFLLKAAQRGVLLRDDEGVQYRVQSLAPPLVAEDQRAESRTVERPVRAQDLRAELFQDRAKPRRPRLDHAPRQPVRVNDVAAKPGQHARHEGLPRSNRTRQSNAQHFNERGNGEMWKRGNGEKEKARAGASDSFPFCPFNHFPPSPLIYSAPPACRDDGVLHQHGDREQADAAGHRRQSARNPPDLRRVHVARERVATLAQSFQTLLRVSAEKLAHARLVRQAVHANVNDGRARLHVLAAYEARAPDGHDEYVGLPRHSFQVSRARVADGDGRVVLQEKLRRGATDVVAAPDDDCARARDFDSFTHEQFDYPGGRARQKRRLPQHHPTDVDRRETVNVLRRVNRLDDGRLVHARGQRQLHEDAVNVLARVAGGNQFEKLRGCRLRQERVVL